MYTVVGCRNCRALWTVEGRPETTQCPRCRTRHRFEMLRSFAETETSEAAARVRSSMLANRTDDGEFLDPAEIDIDAVGMDDEDFLAASGVDPEAVAAAETRVENPNRSRSRKQVVLDGLEELDEPTAAELTEYAASAGIEGAFVERTLEKLHRAGEITRTNDGYRKL
jgi:DNA replicative helicase MCM subunit Mcm2 (Cdc46/Mcm family)